MGALSVRLGFGVFGAPFMKFTLTYDGPLPASANKAKNEDKWRIRKELHPQLLDLWAAHPALRQVQDNRHFPRYGGATLTQVHHFQPGPILPGKPTDEVPAVTLSYGSTLGRPAPSGEREILDLCEPLDKHGAWFRPLVRNSFALHCGLKLFFLRHEEPGKVYQGGDLDGRIKTLLDALAMPQHKEQVLEPGMEDAPIYCLLEDDALVSGLQVESERLLNGRGNAPDHVRLNIEVDVRVRLATIYNQSFLG